MGQNRLRCFRRVREVAAAGGEVAVLFIQLNGLVVSLRVATA